MNVADDAMFKAMLAKPEYRAKMEALMGEHKRSQYAETLNDANESAALTVGVAPAYETANGTTKGPYRSAAMDALRRAEQTRVSTYQTAARRAASGAGDLAPLTPVQRGASPDASYNSANSANSANSHDSATPRGTVSIKAYHAKNLESPGLALPISSSHLFNGGSQENSREDVAEAAREALRKAEEWRLKVTAKTLFFL